MMLVQWLRFATAFVLAPLALSGLLSLLCVVSGDLKNNCLSMFLPILAVTLGHSLVLGVPVATKFHFDKSLTLRKTLLAGAIIGSLPTTLLLAWLHLGHSNEDWYRLNNTSLEVHGHLTVAGWFLNLAICIVLALCGAVGAAIWWVVALGHRLTDSRS